MPATTTRFSAKAHTRPNYTYSVFHQSLLHENNAEDYALRHIYSLENTKVLLEKWGWTSEHIKVGIDNATIDVYKNVVWLHIPNRIEKRGQKIKIKGICRFISKVDYVAVLVERAWDKADPYKLVPGDSWNELIAKGMNDEFYELHLNAYEITCTCHAYQGLEKAFAQDALAGIALINNPIAIGQTPDKHVFAAWKYLGAANQRQYEYCWANRKDAYLIEQRGRDWEFEDEEIATW